MTKAKLSKLADTYLAANQITDNRRKNLKLTALNLFQFILNNWSEDLKLLEEKIEADLASLSPIEKISFLGLLNNLIRSHLYFSSNEKDKPISEGLYYSIIRILNSKRTSKLKKLPIPKIEEGIFVIDTKALFFKESWIDFKDEFKIKQQTLGINPEATGYQVGHPLALSNSNTYDSNGNLIKTANNPTDYIDDFCQRIEGITPRYEIEKFIDFHFTNSTEKGTFLKIIEFEVKGELGKGSLEQVSIWQKKVEKYRWIIDIVEACAIKETYQNQLTANAPSSQINKLIQEFDRIEDVLELMGEQEAIEECNTYLSKNKNGYKDLTSIPEGNRDSSFLSTKFILETGTRFYRNYTNTLLGQFEVNEKPKASIREKSKKKRLYTLFWHGKDDLQSFWEKVNIFFNKSESFETFQSVFSKIEINESFTPIKWYNSNASELLFFIKTMQVEELIEKPNRQNYLQLKACFFNHDGKPFEHDFKHLLPKVDINLGSEKQSRITTILSTFK